MVDTLIFDNYLDFKNDLSSKLRLIDKISNIGLLDEKENVEV